jgi:hypothetical protein
MDVLGTPPPLGETKVCEFLNVAIRIGNSHLADQVVAKCGN